MSVRESSPALAYLRQISEGNYVSPKEKALNDKIAKTHPNFALATAIAFGALALVSVYYKTSYYPVLIGILGAIGFGKTYVDINEENQKRQTDGSKATKQMFVEATAYVRTCHVEKIWSVQQLLVDQRLKLNDHTHFVSVVENAKTQYDNAEQPLTRLNGSEPSVIIKGNPQFREESGKVKEYAAKILTLSDSPADLCNEWAGLTLACRQYPEIGLCGLKVIADSSPYDTVSMQKIVKEI